MEHVAPLIMQIGKVRGRNDKVALLKRYAAEPGFKEILQFIYNPYIKTGIAKAKLSKARVGSTNDDAMHLTWAAVINHFTVHQTGSERDANFAKQFVMQFAKSSDAYLLAEAMVTKNLKIGITEKTLNQIYGDGFIPMVGIMKAETYEDFKHKVKGPFIVTEKHDGGRRTIKKENGTVTLYTRSGHIDEGLYQIEEEVKHLPDNCVYDGELLAIGEFNNAIELRQATNSIANSQGRRTGLTFNIFDMLPVDEYKLGKSTQQALVRKVMIAAMFGDRASLVKLVGEDTADVMLDKFFINAEFNFIKPVDVLGIAHTEQDVIDFATPIWQRGYEGVMLNTLNGLYDMTKDRSRDILKVKCVEEHTLTVIDIEEGTNKNQGRVGALVLNYRGNRVGCGSGLTDAQRISWWNDRRLIVGKQVEIECFGESHNQNGGTSLNCPIFKRVVGHD